MATKPQHDRFSQLVVRKSPDEVSEQIGYVLKEFYCPRDGGIVYTDNDHKVEATVGKNNSKARLTYYTCGDCQTRYIADINISSGYNWRTQFADSSLKCSKCVVISPEMVLYLGSNEVIEATNVHDSGHEKFKFNLAEWLADGRHTPFYGEIPEIKGSTFWLGERVRTKAFDKVGNSGTIETSEDEDGMVGIKPDGWIKNIRRTYHYSELVRMPSGVMEAVWIVNLQQRLLETADYFKAEHEIVMNPTDENEKFKREALHLASFLRQLADRLIEEHLSFVDNKKIRGQGLEDIVAGELNITLAQNPVSLLNLEQDTIIIGRYIDNSIRYRIGFRTAPGVRGNLQHAAELLKRRVHEAQNALSDEIKDKREIVRMCEASRNVMGDY